MRPHTRGSPGCPLKALTFGAFHHQMVDEEADEYEEQALPSFKCPITHRVMRDPVVAADGHCYERSAISAWFARRGEGQQAHWKGIFSHCR